MERITIPHFPLPAERRADVGRIKYYTTAVVPNISIPRIFSSGTIADCKVGTHQTNLSPN